MSCQGRLGNRTIQPRKIQNSKLKTKKKKNKKTKKTETKTKNKKESSASKLILWIMISLFSSWSKNLGCEIIGSSQKSYCKKDWLENIFRP